MKRNRGGLLLLLASLGAVISSILAIQEFILPSDTCLGLGDTGSSSINCESVTASDPLKSLGLNSSLAGVIYFILLFALVYIYHNVPKIRSSRFDLLKIAVHTGTAFMSVLTIYHLFSLDNICIYCLTIFGITVLLSLSVYQSGIRMYKHKINYIYLTIGILLLIAPGVFALTQLGQISFEGCDIAEDVKKKHPEHYSDLISGGVTTGNPDAEIVVVEFFDPFCSHCRRYYPKMKTLESEYGDQVKFVYQLFLLRQNHILVHNALYLAADNGKYFDLLDKLFFDYQWDRPFTIELLTNYLREIDIYSEENYKKIRQGYYSRDIMQLTQTAVDAGIQRTPTILVNGKRLNRYNSLEQCLKSIVD